jgi:hypothetical protein
MVSIVQVPRCPSEALGAQQGIDQVDRYGGRDHADDDVFEHRMLPSKLLTAAYICCSDREKGNSNQYIQHVLHLDRNSFPAAKPPDCTVANERERLDSAPSTGWLIIVARTVGGFLQRVCY